MSERDCEHGSLRRQCETCEWKGRAVRPSVPWSKSMNRYEKKVAEYWLRNAAELAAVAVMLYATARALGWLA